MNYLRSLAFLLAFPLCSFATPGEVWVVDEGGTADFTDIQSAILAVAQGDTILILPGSYSSFVIDSKSLSLCADEAGLVDVNGVVRLRNLSDTQHIDLNGLGLLDGLRVNDCDGDVRFNDCEFLATGLSDDDDQSSFGSHRIVNSNSVVFSRSVLQGRGGESVPYCPEVTDGLHGESAVYLDASRVAFYSCDVTGGQGGWSQAGWCGFGCTEAHASDGGDGIFAGNGSQLYLDDTDPVGGLRGDILTTCGFPPGQADGLDVRLSGGALAEWATEPVLALESPTLVREDRSVSLTVRGPMDTTAWIIWSESPDWRVFGGDLGILHLDSQDLHFELLGTIPAGGELNTSIMPPAVPAGMGARRLSVQAYGLAPVQGRVLGTPSSLTVLDAAF
jgi:hypothetical protein